MYVQKDLELCVLYMKLVDWTPPASIYMYLEYYLA